MPGARVARGERVSLRTVESEDDSFVQRALANPDVRYPMGNPVMSRAELERHREESDDDRFLVCLEADDVGPGRPAEEDVTRIGQVNVDDADYKRPELGYWLVPDVHGEGYGAEAVSLAVDYAFREYDTPAVGAEAYDFNDASRGLLESLGFVEEGRRRKYMFVDGEHRDMVQYGLLREEWRERD
ncbi:MULTISPECIES: GNAT family N-acetyltransferase [Halorussus]|uniref:GNAT family N-acetyltransferase n=1 Tax=Halorussus TaxID=1070314 RepID=UPI00209DCD07|nr:GNAT family protein [Halorussus vallis]USZ76868.1 GNAT family N-acetyltransferase [Halorussus vallis]